MEKFGVFILGEGRGRPCGLLSRVSPGNLRIDPYRPFDIRFSFKFLLIINLYVFTILTSIHITKNSKESI